MTTANVAQELTEVIAANPAPKGQAAQTFVEAIGANPAPAGQVAQIYFELIASTAQIPYDGVKLIRPHFIELPPEDAAPWRQIARRYVPTTVVPTPAFPAPQRTPPLTPPEDEAIWLIQQAHRLAAAGAAGASLGTSYAQMFVNT